MAVGGEHGSKAVVAALIGNTGIAIAKFIGFGITRSSSMLAESIHSVADAGNQGLLLLGGRQAKKEADDEHQFGYGRERYFWSFVVALILFTLGSAFAVFEGIDKIRHPHEIDNFGVALVILGFGICLEAWSFRTAIVESIPLKGDLSWWQFIRRSRTPELPVVLLEDLGAQIGLVIAFVAILISEVFDAPIWDGIGTLSIGLLLGVIAIILVIEMRSLLIGEGATERDMDKILAAIDDAPGVDHLIHIKTQHIGPDELLIGAKIEFDNDLTVGELAAAVNGVEEAIRAEVPYARPIYIEPDLLREEAAIRAGDDYG
ncbi:MAG: cation diffusion facilitator family transporter [Acidimicrobiia bacterium]|nr:cation diffusion facilitator family transporter [Acidimicrobiia bacterium]